MFCAESPGKEETIQRVPLIGRSGQYFTNNILVRIGLTREDVYIPNICKCRPEKNRTPIAEEMIACRSILDAEICLNDPKLIVGLGSVPLFGLCEEYGITKKRGRIINSIKWSNGKVYPVFPMLHPSYILRGNGHKEMAEDIEKLKEMAKSL